jgi:hypothetical protein
MILPFTPPQGWVEMPRAAVSTQVANSWQSPVLPGGKHATFSTITMPFPGSVDALSTAMKSHQHSGPVQVISNTPVRVCGVPGRMIALKTGTGAHAMLIQQELLAKNGRGYMAVYIRPAGTAADAGIATAMKQFCPSGNADLPQLKAPPRWTVQAEKDMHMLGMWMGTHPGEMMMLMRSTDMQPLSSYVNEFQTGMKSPEASKYVKTLTTRRMQLCGAPALSVAMDLNVPSFPMHMEGVVTQSKGVTYMLTYTRPASEAADPAVQTSLQSLCASGLPQPSPSATPAPLPSSSPLPSLSPSPAPTVTPI